MKSNTIKIKKKNNKTLKNRIYRMVSMLNFFSLLFLLIAFVVTLGIVINSVSGVITEKVAKETGAQLSKIWQEESTSKVNVLMSQKKGFYENLVKQNDVVFKILERDSGKPNVKNLQTTLRENKSFLDFRPLDFKIVHNGTVVFPLENMPTKPKSDKFMNILSSIKLFSVSNTVEVKDDAGKIIGTVKVGINQQVILIGVIGFTLVSFIFFMGALFVSRIGIRALSNIIVKPLIDLEIKMNQIASGELEAAMNTEIILKRPVREVESLAEASNKIMSRMHTFVGALANQKLELEAQNIHLQDNSSSLELMNEELAQRNIKLKNIMDNIEQGFFTFKKDLVIYSEYSLFCEKIFSSYLNNRKLSSLLFPENVGMQSFVDDLLIKIFEASHVERKKFFPLLPEELTINDCSISIAYKIVSDEKNEENMMVIITDITEKRLLEKRMDEERKTLKMVVKSIINRNEFLEIVKDFEQFLEHDFRNFSSEEYDHFLRQIHTFKGSFSQYEMVNLVPKLNELEDNLYKYGTEYNGLEIDTTEYRSWLEADIEIIHSYAGKDFMKEGEYCYVKKEKLIEIEKKIQQTLTKQECKVILPMIKNLRYKSIKEMLHTYPEYVDRLSERLGKSIKPFEILGDEVMVDTNYYNRVIKALSHVFRNCIDHGIETEDERLESGKEQFGNLSCEVKKLGNSFQIIISDDGRGIDLETLENKVIAEGLYTKEEWDRMSLKQKNDLILEQGITTKDEANYISGRGVGMAAVKECLSEIAGSITLESIKSKGTIFTIELPLRDGVNEMEVDSEQFISELVETSKAIIMKNTGLELKPSLIKSENTIVLNNITSLISLSGTLNSLIMISVNNIMAYELAKGFIVDDLNDEEIKNYAEDVLAEISNTVLGNTFAKFESTKAIFHIGLPAVLSNNDAYVKYTQSQILSCSLQYDNYEFDVNMLLVEDEIDLDDLKEGL